MSRLKKVTSAKGQLCVSKLEPACQEVTSYLRALSHPQRLMILGHLSLGERTVSELEGLCEISQSQLSQFLARLKAEGLVSSIRRGRYVYYRIHDERLSRLLVVIQDLFCTMERPKRA